jgi:hypothetical protein
MDTKEKQKSAGRALMDEISEWTAGQRRRSLRKFAGKDDDAEKPADAPEATEEPCKACEEGVCENPDHGGGEEEPDGLKLLLMAAPDEKE